MERQFIRLGFSFIVMFGLAQAPLGVFRFFSTYAYGAGLLMLIAVLLFGDMGKGAQRWLDLGFFNLQPSEVMKIALVMALARYFHGLTGEDVQRFRWLIVPIVMVMAPAGLVLVEPDLGTAVLLIDNLRTQKNVRLPVSGEASDRQGERECAPEKSHQHTWDRVLS